jgi:hypothetical protein
MEQRPAITAGSVAAWRKLKAGAMSDLDLDQLIHTPEGRLVMDVLNRRRLPLMIVLQDKQEAVFWYPPVVLTNFDNDAERACEWIRLLEDHVAQLRKRYPVQ